MVVMHVNCSRTLSSYYQNILKSNRFLEESYRQSDKRTSEHRTNVRANKNGQTDGKDKRNSNVRSQIMVHHQFIAQFHDCLIKCV